MTEHKDPQNIELAEIDSTPSDEIVISKQDFGLFKDVSVNAEIFLGATDIKVETLFSLTAGEVLELDANIEEPIVLRVNGETVAVGNLVAIDGNFGIEITEVASKR